MHREFEFSTVQVLAHGERHWQGVEYPGTLFPRLNHQIVVVPCETTTKMDMKMLIISAQVLGRLRIFTPGQCGIDGDNSECRIINKSAAKMVSVTVE